MPKYNNIPAGLTFDMRVEALAAAIMECEPELFSSPEQFLVKPMGHLTRSTDNEVLSVTETPDPDEDISNLILQINREGMFDILPAGLFIHPDEHYEDDVEKAEQLSKQMEEARRFLLPFEEIFYQARISIECHEKAVGLQPENFLKKILEDGSEQDGDDKLHSQRRALMLFAPMLDQLVGDPEQCRMVLERIFGKKVTMQAEAPDRIMIPMSMQTRLGEDAALGENIVVGDYFTDGIPVTKLEIKEDNMDQMDAWLPGQFLRQFAEKNVLPLFFSSETPVTLEISPEEPTNGFVLDDKRATSMLGYATYI